MLVSKFFEPKFAIARTKRESVIVKCISQMIAAELRQESDKTNFVSVAIDASNKKKQGRRRAGHDRGIASLHFCKRGNRSGGAFL